MQLLIHVRTEEDVMMPGPASPALAPTSPMTSAFEATYGAKLW